MDSLVISGSVDISKKTLLKRIKSLFVNNLKWFLGIAVTILIALYVNQKRPDLTIILSSSTLGQHASGAAALLYKLKNSGDVTAYNIKKGHMVFNLKEGNSTSCKHFYEPVENNDVLKSGESSPGIHADDIGFLNKEDSYKIQLITSYTSLKSQKTKVYYSLINLEVHPREGAFLVIPKSKNADNGLIDAAKIKNAIDNCRWIDF